MTPDEQLISEARILFRYLFNSEANDKVIVLYCKAIKKCQLIMTEKEKRILKFVLKTPFCIGFIDAALAPSHIRSDLRKRIYIMLATSETVPECYHFFKSELHSKWYIISVMFQGIRAILRYVTGIILIQFI